MIEEVPAALLNGVGVVGVVLLMGWLVVTGRLVPRSTHLDVCEERNHWRKAEQERSQQLTVALEAAELGSHALQEISAAAQKKGQT